MHPVRRTVAGVLVLLGLLAALGFLAWAGLGFWVLYGQVPDAHPLLNGASVLLWPVTAIGIAVSASGWQGHSASARRALRRGLRLPR